MKSFKFSTFFAAVALLSASTQWRKLKSLLLQALEITFYALHCNVTVIFHQKDICAEKREVVTMTTTISYVS